LLTLRALYCAAGRKNFAVVITNAVTHFLATHPASTFRPNAGSTPSTPTTPSSSSSPPASAVGGNTSDFAKLILHLHPRPGSSTVNRTA